MAGFIQYPSNTCHLTKNQSDALAGTQGTPGDTNRYVTEQDSRMSLASDTNSGIMSASDYTLLHSLANASLSGLTDLQMSMLAQVTHNILSSDNTNLLMLPELLKYVNLITFKDGILPSGSSITNLSRNAGSLELAPDSTKSSITLLDDCTSTGSWKVYNPDDISGFSHSVVPWDLVGGNNALKLTLVNSAALNNDWYLITAVYRRHNFNGAYGLLVTTKVEADNNPVIGGWDNRYSRCVKQNIEDSLFYEDFWIPFKSRQNISDMTIGIYAMFPASPMIAWFSNIRAVGSDYLTMVDSGSFTSPVYSYSKNIKDIIPILNIESSDIKTGNVILDISLDGGNHWRTNVPYNVMLNVSSDLPNANGTPWDNIRNLRYRFTINKGVSDKFGTAVSVRGSAVITRLEQ